MYMIESDRDKLINTISGYGADAVAAPLRPNWAIRISPCIASASITQGNTAARMDWLQHSERCNTTI